VTTPEFTPNKVESIKPLENCSGINHNQLNSFSDKNNQRNDKIT